MISLDDVESKLRDLANAVNSLKQEQSLLRQTPRSGEAVVSSCDVDALKEEVYRLREENEGLRQWKASSSTAILNLQQQLRRKAAIEASANGSLCSVPLVDDMPSVDRVQLDDSQQLQREVPAGNALALKVAELREDLQSSRTKIKQLEEELIVSRARLIALETRSSHHSSTNHSANSRMMVKLPLQVEVTRLHEVKSAIIESTLDLRDALERKGSIALPLLPHHALDIALLAVSLRDHCRLACRMLNTE